MLRRLRRLLTLGALSGAALSGVRYARSRRRRADAQPVWPPFDTEPPAITNALISEPIVANAAAQLPWVLPIDGACPDGYPVKANDGSKIFHVPGGRSYDRTIPERCYSTPEGALVDGYRAAKA
jgi:hypothetical protein